MSQDTNRNKNALQNISRKKILQQKKAEQQWKQLSWSPPPREARLDAGVEGAVAGEGRGVVHLQQVHLAPVVRHDVEAQDLEAVVAWGRGSGLESTGTVTPVKIKAQLTGSITYQTMKMKRNENKIKQNRFKIIYKLGLAYEVAPDWARLRNAILGPRPQVVGLLTTKTIQED